jgi:hypothetical protein
LLASLNGFLYTKNSAIEISEIVSTLSGNS